MERKCDNCRNCTWKDGLSQFPDICLKCKYVDVDGRPQPSNWKPLPMTNADRIRAMSDEELAYIFSDFCKGMENCEHCICYDNCPGESAVCWMKWLQQPADKGE